MLERVLIGMDFSEYSENALKTIFNLEPKPNEVIIVRVVNIKRFKGADVIREKNIAEERLSKIVEEFRRRGVEANYLIPIGNPPEEIVKIADSLNASLIVLGHRGRGLISKLLGSTTLNVIKSTDRPVLVVKTEQKDLFMRVLFCYHPLVFNEDIKGCIERLPFKEMILLHVVEPLLPPEAKREEMKNRVKFVEQFLNDVKSKLKGSVDVVVKIGDPAKVTLETAEDIDATCIILSTRAKRPILGGTTDYILKNSKISVLVCKELLRE